MTQVSAGLPTGTVTFVFTDIEGSTRLVQELGPAVYTEILERHNRLVRDVIARHGGIERGTEGDSFLVVFTEAAAAVAAAVETQRAIAAEEWPGGVELRVRMGINTGSAFAGGDDYVSLDLNRAARIAAAAHGGQVLVSAATAALSETDLPEGVLLRDLGSHRLKDLSRPERLLQLTIAGLPASFPPPRTAGRASGDLPARLDAFVGREADLATLEELLGGSRLLTLIGPGGTGKTSLAIELARRASPGFDGGAWFVPLDEIRDPDLVWGAVAARLRIVELVGGADASALGERLAGRPLLLVLDNFEQVLPAAREVVALLRSAPDLRIVVTSRVALRVTGEQDFPVAPLSVPEAEADLDSAGSVDAVRLFVDRARRAQPGFALTPANVRAVAEICLRLDGLPLAIELAAARVGILDPATIADRLDRRLDLPGTVSRDRPERQRTLERAIGWSHDLLGEAARTLLALMSVFRGGARLQEIQSVCEFGPDGGGGDLLDTLTELVEHSLVQPVAGPEGPRYRLLETVRMFAAERLAERGDSEASAKRHAEAYLALATEASRHLPGPEQVRWLARLTAEHDNLRAAVRRALDHDVRMALRFAGVLWRFWQLRGHVREGIAAVTEALGMPGADEPTVERMRALEAAAGLHYWSAEPKAAHELYEAQLELAQRLGDERGIADAVFNLAHTFGILGDTDRASVRAEEAEQRFAALGDDLMVMRTRWTRGIILQNQGDREASLPVFETTLAEARRLGDTPYVALAQGSLAWASMQRGDPVAALAYGVRSMLEHHGIGDIATTTINLQASAVLFAKLDRPRDAVVLHGAFEALASRHGVRPPSGLAEVMGFFWRPEELIETLGRASWDEAMAAGARMSLDEAVDYVVEAARPIDPAPDDQ